MGYLHKSPYEILLIRDVKRVFAEYNDYFVMGSDNALCSEIEYINEIIDKLGIGNNDNLMFALKNISAIIYFKSFCPVACAMLKYLSGKCLTYEQKKRRDCFRRDISVRDGKCVITGIDFRRCEAAHILDFAICPTEVEQYDVDNGILLDRSLHHCWDRGYIIAVPNACNNTVEFKLNDMLGLPRDELLNICPELTESRVLNNINPRMIDYFIQRYNLDIDRFCSSN